MKGFCRAPQPGETFEDRVRAHARKFIGRGEPGASEIMANLFDPDYLLKHELVFIGSPETVARKIRARPRRACSTRSSANSTSRICRSRPDALDQIVRRKGDPGAARI